ncbi:hypothetical protein ABZ642_15390 [Streptomyces sp. NPDC007157]|uniref:hypothetical protein n=1 Tax=Streptomyces sp. NPDC007157 TaxID=3154681 RepID=UPI0033F9C8B6
MPDTTPQATELTSQYSAQVAGDLERNLKEQDRLSSEIEALQAQLAAVRHDHTVLVNIQQALGIPAAPDAPAAEPVAAVPAPRNKAAGASDAAQQKKARKTAATARKRTGEKKSAQAPAAPSASPTLVELVHEHLTGQSEPRSAAEITAALAQQHPERAIKTTVVRTTLEGLVAKSQAQRTVQGRSVFYTTPESAEASEPAAHNEQTAQQSA